MSQRVIIDCAFETILKTGIVNMANQLMQRIKKYVTFTKSILTNVKNIGMI